MLANPYARKASNAATTGVVARLPTDMSQNLEIASLSREVSALKTELALLRTDLENKANKDEVSAILAWDLSDAARRHSPPVVTICAMILAMIVVSIVDAIVRSPDNIRRIADEVATQIKNNTPVSSSSSSIFNR